MDRKRNIGNTNRPQRRQNLRRNRLTRRTRRQAPRPNRNRLSRAQNNINRNRLGLNRRRRYNNFRRRNFGYRIIYVGNLPFDVNSRRLRQLLLWEEWDLKDMDLSCLEIQEMLGRLLENGIILL